MVSGSLFPSLLALSQVNSLCEGRHTHTHLHTHTHSHTHSLSLSLSHRHTHSHTHTHTHSHTHTHAHALSLFLSLSHTLSRTHTNTLSLTHTGDCGRCARGGSGRGSHFFPVGTQALPGISSNPVGATSEGICLNSGAIAVAGSAAGFKAPHFPAGGRRERKTFIH